MHLAAMNGHTKYLELMLAHEGDVEVGSCGLMYFVGLCESESPLHDPINPTNRPRPARA